MSEKERITKSIQEFGEDAKCGHHGNLLNGKPCPDCFPEFYKQRQEPVSLKRIVSGTMVATAGNAINSLSSLISGIANGKRKDLLEIDLQNAKDQIELLTDNMQKYH